MKAHWTSKLKVGDEVGTNDSDTLKYKYRNKNGIVVRVPSVQDLSFGLELVMNKKGRKEVVETLYKEWLCPCSVEVRIDKKKTVKESCRIIGQHINKCHEKDCVKRLSCAFYMNNSSHPLYVTVPSYSVIVDALMFMTVVCNDKTVDKK